MWLHTKTPFVFSLHMTILEWMVRLPKNLLTLSNEYIFNRTKNFNFQIDCNYQFSFDYQIQHKSERNTFTRTKEEGTRICIWSRCKKVSLIKKHFNIINHLKPFTRPSVFALTNANWEMVFCIPSFASLALPTMNHANTNKKFRQ